MRRVAWSTDFKSKNRRLYGHDRPSNHDGTSQGSPIWVRLGHDFGYSHCGVGVKMNGNLDVYYQLRIDRLERLREKFRRGAIHETEFRDMLGAEGIIDRGSQDAEVMACQPGMRPIGEIIARVMERVRP